MGKVIFISGLRRSGTTILSDILTEFKEIKLFYEPFGNNHASVGGGSGLKKIDVNKNTRVAKESFLKKHDNISIDYLNRGAPKNHILEIENKKLDDIETSFLRSIIHGSNQVPLLKFTRATFLTPQLYNIAKNALFLHVIREPRSWVSAHLTCSNKNHKILKNSKLFFKKDRGFNWWSMENIANDFVKVNNYSLWKKPGYYKLLYIWHNFNKKIQEEGKMLFNENYVKVPLENLITDYKYIVQKVGEFIESKNINSVCSFAKNVLVKSNSAPFEDHLYWRSAFREIGIDKMGNLK